MYMNKLITTLLLVVLLVISPITSTASDFYARTMPVELEVTSKTISVQQSGDSLTVETVKDAAVQIKFTALISCGAPLDIFAFDNKAKIEVFSYSAKSGDGQCKIWDTLSFPGENNDYILVFVSPGTDGIYGNNMQREQFRNKYTSYTSKTRDQLVEMIIADTIGIAGNDDSVAQKLVRVKTVIPEISLTKIEWNNDELEITGQTNLPSGAKINAWLVGKGFDWTKKTSVKSRGQFELKFNQAGMQGGDYRLIIETEKGDYIDEFSFNIQPSSITVGTAVTEQEPVVTTTPAPVLVPATPTPTPVLPPGFVLPTPTPTPTPTPVPAETKRPYLTILVTIILGIILVILVIKKRNTS